MFKKIKLSILSCLIISFIIPSFTIADDLPNIDESYISTSSDANSSTSELEINSKAAVVIERSTNTILYGKSENEKRKMASTTKIMTAIVVIESANLSDTVEISSKAAGTGGSRLGLSKNAKITVNDLLYGLLLCSGNDAAVALAEYVGGSVAEFAELMNQKASELNLSSTHFVTPHGLDEDEHYTTAYELALIANYALKSETFSKIVGTKNYTVTINGNTKNISNTNELLGYLNGVYGVKTGFTNGANRCLVSSCKRGNLDIICVVLGADTKKNRTQDSIKLIEYAFDNFEMINIKNMIEENFNNWVSSSPKFIVAKGCTNDISPMLENLNYELFPVNKNNINNINININCKYSFEAPLIQNSTIGTLSLYIDSSKIIILNIYAKNTIDKKNVYDYFKLLNRNLTSYLENIL